MKGLIIVGHGSPRTAGNETLPAVTDLVRTRLPGWAVVHAYLRFESPALAEAVARCVRDGAETIVVHPYLLTGGGHLAEEIPALVEKIGRDHPSVTFRITPPLGVHRHLADVIIERVSETLDLDP